MSLVPRSRPPRTGHRGLSCPLKLSRHRLPTSRGAAASPKTEGEPEPSFLHWSSSEAFGTGSPTPSLDQAQKKHNGPRHGRLGRRQGGPRSLLERGELVEGVPEQRRLPLGLRQGEHLLLRDAGGHGDVALVQGVQRLVRRGHGAPAVA